MAIKNATDETFKDEIKEGLVLVDFWATWCGPCKMVAPVLEEISGERGDSLTVVKVDVDANQETASEYGIMSIPTLILMKDGEIKEKVIGFSPKEKLDQIINEYL